jgi:RNA polymerase sigma-70 factor (ECF subfamily)
MRYPANLHKFVTGRKTGLAEQLEILLRECRKGKPKSQEVLYKKFAAAMYGICLQYASSEEDAQDILQEGFVKVFRKLDQVKNPAAFPGWIRRVMINTALEKYRSQVLLQRIDEVREEAEEATGDGVFDNLTCQELVGLIQTLPPRYRMVFNLYAIEGYSHQEIGKELGITVGTSKSNLSRARDILQDRIKKMYGTVLAR